MKKLFLTLFALVMATASLWAYDFKVDDLCYNITDETNKTVEVTYSWVQVETNYFTGDEYHYYHGSGSGNVRIPSSVTHNGASYSVTSIGSHAFSECRELTSVTIPNCVTKIDFGAFYDCTELTSITIPNSVTSIGNRAFYDCTSLTSVTIGNSVTSIGYEAFSGCTDLTSVTIGNSVTSIGPFAFYNTPWYNNQPDGVIYINKVLYDYKGTMPKNTSIEIKEGTVSISPQAFWYCSGLTSITIPNSVTLIEDAFFECTGLTTVNFNATNCTTMDSPFNGCTNLTTVTIGENVTRIPNYAFSGCTGLTTVNSNAIIIEIEEYAFDNTPWYTNQPDGVIYLGKVLYTYKGTMPENTSIEIKEGTASINPSAFNNCTRLTSVTIPNSVSFIGSYAFYGTGLTTVHFNATNCTSISSSAFSGCDQLTTVNIGENVTSIPSYAFSGCTGLTSVTIPNSVTSIGSSAFSGCTGLTMVTIADSDTELTIPSDAFPSPIPSLYMGRKINNIQQLDIDELIIGNNFTKVEENLFKDYTKMKELTLGNQVTEIETSAFEGCTGLTELIIPDNVTMIRNSAFGGCTALTSVTLGYGLTRIAGDVFKNCTNIDAVYCRATTPPGASTTTFPEIVQENSTLYVPTGCESVYMTTSPWSNFWDIRELDALGVEDVLAESTTVTVQGGAIVVTGLDAPMNIEVYNLQGQRVYSGYETTIPMNERGIYLVKIANRVVKVVL